MEALPRCMRAMSRRPVTIRELQMEELELVSLWGQQEHFSCTHSELRELYRSYPGAIIGSFVRRGGGGGCAGGLCCDVSSVIVIIDTLINM